MGDLTRAQLMAQAGLAAGNDQATSFVRVWLNAWLSRTAKSWSWPICKKRVSSLAVSAGSRSVVVGNGVSTTIDGLGALTTHKIHRLLGGYVLWRVQTGYSPRGRAFVRTLIDPNPDTDESVTDPSQQKGWPETVKVRKSDNGALTLFLDPVPIQALYLAFDIHFIPPNISTSSANDTTIPWYPNDKTLLQACKVALLELDKGGEESKVYDNEAAKLGAMVIDDRDFDGSEAGDNEVFGLDKSVFLD